MDPARLWLTVERGLPVRGVRMVMDDRLGRELTAALIADRFLVRNGISDHYPCPNTGGTACPRQVLPRRSGGYMAICGSHPPACEDVLLSAEDVTWWRLSEDRLMGAIAVALRLSGRLPSLLQTIDPAWLIGSVPASTAQVVLFPTGEDARIAAGISQVRDQLRGSIQVLVPRSATIGAQALQAARGELAIIGLDQVLQDYDRGSFLATTQAADLWAMPRRAADGDADAFAIAYTAGQRQPLDRYQYEALRRRADEFTVFADAFTRSITRRIAGRRERLTNVKASYFSVLRVVIAADGQAVDVGTADIPGVPNAGKQVFQMARSTIDVKEGPTWLLFKNHRVEARSDYRFAPDAGATYCFLFPAGLDGDGPA